MLLGLRTRRLPHLATRRASVEPISTGLPTPSPSVGVVAGALHMYSTYGDDVAAETEDGEMAGVGETRSRGAQCARPPFITTQSFAR
jgi:hypothetical protein